VAARQQPLEDRVGDSRISDPRMPVLDRQLTRHVARVPARSSITSIRSARVGPSMAARPQSSYSKTSVPATAASQRPKPPLPCSTRRSAARHGTRRYSVECPRRQAHCASAQASQDLPEPVGPVTRIAVPSSTQRDSARLVNGLCSIPVRVCCRHLRCRPAGTSGQPSS